MSKYNLSERKDKDAAYTTLVSPAIMDDLKERILNLVVIQKTRTILPKSLPKTWVPTHVMFLLLSTFDFA